MFLEFVVDGPLLALSRELLPLTFRVENAIASSSTMSTCGSDQNLHVATGVVEQ
jgi:hypothetical protein